MRRIYIAIVIAIILTAMVLFIIDTNVHLEEGRIKNIWFQEHSTICHDTIFIYRETYKPEDNDSKTPEEFRKKLLEDGYVTEFPHSSVDTTYRNDTVIITTIESFAW